MRFGPVATVEAEGAFLAHSLAAGSVRLRKGTRLVAADVQALLAEGVPSVVVARLDAGDVTEDEAAGRLAAILARGGIEAAAAFTGRANLHAASAGLLVVDRDAVDRFNRIDPAITLATLPAFAPVVAGQLVATVKIIPFAVAGPSLAAAERLAGASRLVELARFRPMRVGLVATMLPGLKPSVMDKTRQRLETRLQPAGASLIGERRVPHDEAAVGAALAQFKAIGADIAIVFGASAMVDAGDVVPAGIEAAGGRIVRLGMPVDPGNLLVLGEIDGLPVIGAPGCARSPRENGFDWILHRLLAGLGVTADEIAGLGVGGLLSEIASRPQPRERAGEPEGVAALLLAAGQGRRMGGPNKLLAEIEGRSLVRRAAEAALASRAAPLIVVTGHQSEAVEAALAGLEAEFRFNANYRDGLSTSLRCGAEALPEAVAGALVLLADMPFVTSAMLDRLIAAFEAERPHPIVVPTHGGKRGNPVLWPRRFFAEFQRIEGDTGARHLIGAHADEIVEVEIGEAVALDLDTPEALAEAGGRIAG